LFEDRGRCGAWLHIIQGWVFISSGFVVSHYLYSCQTVWASPRKPKPVLKYGTQGSQRQPLNSLILS
jgi:hypothetical protein